MFKKFIKILVENTFILMKTILIWLEDISIYMKFQNLLNFELRAPLSIIFQVIGIKFYFENSTQNVDFIISKNIS